ncbi:O-antigen ligase family protein [Amniculibacterium sp. G2-70]|uniref:O-antigen ligase family protein n=1 Tax=Amniculibacterium sp. G2-70 TaxID=2767188 RepID=UPI0016548413|nr:O-antigen ligase family protein [Amniculibacterium sp. G2-70]
MNIKLEFIRRLFIMYMNFFMFSGYYLGLALILTTGNVELSKFYSLPVRVLQLVIAIITIIHLNGLRFKIRQTDFYVFLFFIFYLLKVLYTEMITDKIPLHNLWYYYIFYFLFFNYSVYIFFRNINVKKYLHLIVKTQLIAGFLMALVVIIFYRDILFAGEGGRFGANIEGNDDVILSPLAISYAGALNISLLIPYLSYNFKNLNIINKIIHVVNFLLSMFLFVLGSTRGALVVVILSVILFIFSQTGFKKVKYVLLMIPIIPLFYFFLEFTGSSLLDRINRTIENQDMSGRDRLWNEAINEFLKYPIFGGKIEVSGFYPHNIILEILMGTGIVGAALFILILISTFTKNRINRDTIFLYIIFANGFFQYMFSGSIYTAIIMFSAIGLLSGYKINMENGK